MNVIMYDYSFAQSDKKNTYNGGGEYTIEILDEILKEQNINIILMVNSQKEIPYNYENLKSKVYSVMWYDSFLTMSNIVNDMKPQLFFCPVVNSDYSSLKIDDDIKVYLGLHDLSEFYNNMIPAMKDMYVKDDCLNMLRHIIRGVTRTKNIAHFKMAHQQLFSINKQTHVYTVSYYTYNAIKYWLKNTDVCGVFYSPLRHTDSDIVNHDKCILKKYNIESNRFFLSSSARRWTKNNTIAIESFDEMVTDGFINENINYLVLGCDNDYKRFILRMVRNKDRFRFVGFVDALELDCLYYYAYAFVYPTLVEGFGYPPIEAMKYSTVSICSNYTSVPEICGDASIYFNPIDKNSIKIAFLEALDKEYMTLKRSKAACRYKEITNRMRNDTNRLVKMIIGEAYEKD